jgi:ribonuclease D
MEAHRAAIEAEANNPGARARPEMKESPTLVLARAYIDGAGRIDKIDRRIASYETRRNAMLREMSTRRERMARKLDRASSDVIDGEFTEAAE